MEIYWRKALVGDMEKAKVTGMAANLEDHRFTNGMDFTNELDFTLQLVERIH